MHRVISSTMADGALRLSADVLVRIWIAWYSYVCHSSFWFSFWNISLLLQQCYPCFFFYMTVCWKKITAVLSCLIAVAMSKWFNPRKKKMFHKSLDIEVHCQSRTGDLLLIWRIHFFVVMGQKSKAPTCFLIVEQKAEQTWVC